mgnify:CR=1 FL=1
MLSIENLRIVFNAGTVNEKTALDGVSLTLEEGDFVTVIGGNGAGKSTLLNCVAGVYMPAQGKISIGGVDVTRMPEHKRAKLLGRVFQDPMMGTSGNMWIEENLALANRRGKPRTLRWGISNAERAEYKKQLATLGLGLEERGVRATLQDERSRITFVRSGETRAYPKEEFFYFSAFPMEGRAEGVCEHGSYYELTDDVLVAGYPLGVSNEYAEGSDCITISTRKGALVVVETVPDTPILTGNKA